MKILYQNIVTDAVGLHRDFNLPGDPPTSDPTADNVLNLMQAVASEGTEIVWRDLKASSYLVNYSYLELANSLNIIDAIVDAEKEGFDAVIIGCGNDPFLWQARQAVDIPVIGPTESAIYTALAMGYKFGLITVMGMTNVCHQYVHQIGLDYRFAGPAYYYEAGDGAELFANLEQMLTDSKVIIPQFDELARKCVAQGAEVVIPACTRLGPAAAMAGYREVPGTGAPVLCVNETAVKMAEYMVQMQKIAGTAKSQVKVFKSAPVELRDQLRSLAGGR